MILVVVIIFCIKYSINREVNVVLSLQLSVVGWHGGRGICWNWCWGISRGWGISWSWGIGWGRGMVSLFVLDEALVGAGDTLVLDVSVVLLVLVNKVVHDLSPAVGQLHSVLTCNTLTG